MSAENDKMDGDTAETSTEKSLSNLDDFTVMDICQFLKYDDLVNLSKTCKRLRDMSKLVFPRKYSEIKVIATVRMPSDNGVSTDTKSQQDFYDFSAMLGKHILHITEQEQELQPRRPSEESVTLLFTSRPLREEPLPLRNYRSLETLTLPDVIINADELEKCFIHNPDLQCQFNGSYGPAAMTLLNHFPNITSLRLENKKDHNERLNIELFNLVKSFGNLRYLLLVAYTVDNCVLDTVVFPLMLRKIKIHTPALSFNTFSTIVKRLEFLEEIDLGNCNMFWYQGKSVILGKIKDPLLVSQIVKEFKHRKLNILYDDLLTTDHFVYKSNNLNIVNSCWRRRIW